MSVSTSQSRRAQTRNGEASDTITTKPQTPTGYADPSKDPFDSMGQIDMDYVREITQNELPERTYHYLRVFMTLDFVMSNLKRAEVHEIKYLALIEAKRIIMAHPHDECLLSGEFGKEFYGLDTEVLQALRWDQEAMIQHLAVDVHVRVARSRDGWQQDKINESLNVHRDDTQREEKKGRIMSLFS